MSDTTTKIVSELDFETIRNNIASFIANNSTFTDYNFEGSGLSFLMDVLAYNTHYNALYLNMAVNENFMDTAQLRSSIVSLARNMGYTPRSATSALAYIQFKIPTTDPAGTQLSIGPSTLFTATNNGISYVFSPTTTQYTQAISGFYTFSGAAGSLGVPIREGSYVTLNYTAVGLPNEKFIINNSNIDLSSITVSVQPNSTSTSVSTYSLISDITQLTPNSNIYYLWETVTQNYEIQFGDGVLGSILTAGNIVNITYQTSLADAGNGCNQFTLANKIGIYSNSNVVYTNVIPAFGGQVIETIESVRTSALQNFRTQGRAVTIDDYKFFLSRDYPFASTISVWGGQDNNPPQYGKVFLSFKPVVGYTLTNSEKTAILSDIISKYNIISILPEIIDPEYIFLQVNTDVYYNSKSTTLNSGDIKTAVINSITNYNNTILNEFGTNFTYSQFTTIIDESSTSIIGNLTQISMRKNVPVILNNSLTYTIDFQNIIHPGSVTNKYPFQAANNSSLNSGTQNLYFDDDGGPNATLGNIRIFTYVSDGINSIQVYISNNAGTVDYVNGIVTLTNFNPSLVNADSTIDIIVKPVDYAIGNITSKRNTILTINPTDITVNVTAK